MKKVWESIQDEDFKRDVGRLVLLILTVWNTYSVTGMSLLAITTISLCTTMSLLDITKDKNVMTYMKRQKSFIRIAAEKGHLDCLEYLHNHGCPWDEWACDAAAGGGNLDCLRYLHNHGCEWSMWACYRAARGGHLECLVYLHENGCPWNEYACYAAALGKHLDCLQYMRDNGLEWNKYAYYLNSTK